MKYFALRCSVANKPGIQKAGNFCWPLRTIFMTTASIIHKNSVSYILVCTLYCKQCTKPIQSFSEVHLNKQRAEKIQLLSQRSSVYRIFWRNPLSSPSLSISSHLISLLLGCFYFNCTHILCSNTAEGREMSILLTTLDVTLKFQPFFYCCKKPAVSHGTSYTQNLKNNVNYFLKLCS